MRLYLLPKTFKGQPSLEIKGKDFVYLTRSLRLKERQVITGRDREGRLWDLCIEKITKDSCTLSAKKAETAQERTDALPQTGPKKTIILYQCLPKGRKADDIIKKATEAGVSAIVLVKSRNCVANLEGKEMTRIERYDAMVTEAIQQSGSMIPTTVSGVIDISEIPDDFEKRTDGVARLGIVLHQSKIENQNNDLFNCLKDFDGAVALVVGPEGGLEESECQALIDRSFKAVVLKTNILRCETASIYAIGAVQTIIESSCR